MAAQAEPLLLLHAVAARLVHWLCSLDEAQLAAVPILRDWDRWALWLPAAACCPRAACCPGRWAGLGACGRLPVACVQMLASGMLAGPASCPLARFHFAPQPALRLPASAALVHSTARWFELGAVAFAVAVIPCRCHSIVHVVFTEAVSTYRMARTQAALDGDGLEEAAFTRCVRPA